MTGLYFWVRNEAEINIKWMLTISFLIHLIFLSGLLFSGIFNKSSSFYRLYTPLSIIHVNIIDIPKVEQHNPPFPPLEKGGRGGFVKAVQEPAKVKEKEIKIQKIEVKVQKEPHKASVAIPEPDLHPSVKTGGQEASQPAESNEKAGGVKEERLIPGAAPDVSVTSGPVEDIPNFQYDYYLGVIRNKIENRWSQPVAHASIKKTLIEFTVHRNGEIRNIRVAESSGDHYFDQTALRAVSVSNPLPPLPRGYKENFLKVRYRFIFGKNGGGRG